MTIFAEIQKLEEAGDEAVLCTVVRAQGSTPRGAGTKMLVYPDGHISGTVGGGEMESRVVQAALEVLAAGQPRLLEYSLSDPKRGDPGVCGGQMEVFVEPIKPQPTVVVVGMGHVGLAVADLAHWLGFRVVVSDDRPELCSPEVVPNADVFHPAALAELPQQVRINSQTYVILTTRNIKIDVAGLPAILETPASYVGVIGSKRRWETTRKKLLKAGVPEVQIERVVSPIGLELNAETPEEIALSILAEIIMLRRGGDGARMGI